MMAWFPTTPTDSGPLDVNNFAQMVVTLECVQPTPDWIALADRTLAAAIRELWRPEMDAFAYQRRGRHINRISYPRWTQIWMMYALGLRLAHRARIDSTIVVGLIAALTFTSIGGAAAAPAASELQSRDHGQVAACPQVEGRHRHHDWCRRG